MPSVFFFPSRSRVSAAPLLEWSGCGAEKTSPETHRCRHSEVRTVAFSRGRGRRVTGTGVVVVVVVVSHSSQEAHSRKDGRPPLPALDPLGFTSSRRRQQQEEQEEGRRSCGGGGVDRRGRSGGNPPPSGERGPVSQVRVGVCLRSREDSTRQRVRQDYRVRPRLARPSGASVIVADSAVFSLGQAVRRGLRSPVPPASLEQQSLCFREELWVVLVARLCVSSSCYTGGKNRAKRVVAALFKEE